MWTPLLQEIRGDPQGAQCLMERCIFPTQTHYRCKNERDSFEILFVKGYCGSGDKYAAGSSVNCTLCKAGFSLCKLESTGKKWEKCPRLQYKSLQLRRLKTLCAFEKQSWRKLWVEWNFSCETMWFDPGFIFEDSLSIYFCSLFLCSLELFYWLMWDSVIQGKKAKFLG